MCGTSPQLCNLSRVSSQYPPPQETERRDSLQPRWERGRFMVECNRNYDGWDIIHIHTLTHTHTHTLVLLYYIIALVIYKSWSIHWDIIFFFFLLAVAEVTRWVQFSAGLRSLRAERSGVNSIPAAFQRKPCRGSADLIGKQMERSQKTIEAALQSPAGRDRGWCFKTIQS